MPDHRLDVLADLYDSAKIVPAVIEFVDIAGLVKGASKGEGLGNQFLSNIREVDLRPLKTEQIPPAVPSFLWTHPTAAFY